jgi:hypothetical protein
MLFLLLAGRLNFYTVQDSLIVHIHCFLSTYWNQVCYTDYEPHYNDKFYLDQIIVGDHEGWTRVNRTLATGGLDVHEKYGYNDTKVSYVGRDWARELHLKVTVGSAGRMKVRECLHAYTLTPRSQCVYMPVSTF